ncbi:GtrA family protein [Alcaligenes sp. Marseille-Q7550]
MPKLRELIFFGLAGTAGFLIDSAMLYMLKDALGLYLARVASFLCAVLGTWLINRSLTFQHRPSRLPLAHEFIRYLGMMMLGGAVNYLVYVLAVHNLHTVREYPVIGVALGSLAGMLVNYAQMKLLLFKTDHHAGHR